MQALLGAVREHIRKKDTFKNNIADAFEISFEDVSYLSMNYVDDGTNTDYSNDTYHLTMTI